MLLGKVSVQCLGVISVGNEVVGYLLSVAACAAEYYGVYVGAVVGHTFEGKVFVAGVDHIVYVPHVFGAFVACAHYNLHGGLHEFIGNLGDFLRHCGRKHEHASVFRDMRKYLVYVINETHVKHFIGLVKHHGMDIAKFNYASVDEVDKPSWGGHDYLYA